MDAPAEPVKKTFCPLFTRLNTCCCVCESLTDGVSFGWEGAGGATFACGLGGPGAGRDGAVGAGGAGAGALFTNAEDFCKHAFIPVS